MPHSRNINNFIEFVIYFAGGIRKEMYPTLPKHVQSKHGFEGCLASLDLNGESPNLLVEAVVPSTQVVSGCEGNRTLLDVVSRFI